jgi:hypothetical protein
VSWIDGQICRGRCNWMGNRRTRKKLVILEQLFRYMFQEESMATIKKYNRKLEKTKKDKKRITTCFE